MVIDQVSVCSNCPLVICNYSTLKGS